jgi:hypothetical protein
MRFLRSVAGYRRIDKKSVLLLFTQAPRGRKDIAPTLDGGEWSASLPGCALPPGKDDPVPGGWMCFRAALNTEAREKNPLPLPGFEPRASSLSDTILNEP